MFERKLRIKRHSKCPTHSILLDLGCHVQLTILKTKKRMVSIPQELEQFLRAFLATSFLNRATWTWVVPGSNYFKSSSADRNFSVQHLVFSCIALLWFSKWLIYYWLCLLRSAWKILCHWKYEVCRHGPLIAGAVWITRFLWWSSHHPDKKAMW